MFWIMANDKILHHPILANDGFVVDNPTVHQELNTQGWMKASVPPNNPLWESISPRKTYIKVYNEKGQVWSGRVSTIEKGWNNCKNIYCEGDLAYLQDSLVRPFVFDGTVKNFLGALLDIHNGQMDSKRDFTLGRVTVSGSVKYDSTGAGTVWDAINSELISKLGGYIVTRTENNVRYVDYLEDFVSNGQPITSGQTVQFGENLMNLTVYTDASKLCTVLVPYGKSLSSGDSGYEEPPESGTWDGNKLTIKSVNGGKDYIKHTQGISLWGEVWGTESWNDISDASELKTKATEYLNKAFRDSLTIEATAIDLSLNDASIDGIEVGTYTRVKSELHGVDELLLCRSKETPLTQLQNSKILLGAGETSLTDLQGGRKKK